MNTIAYDLPNSDITYFPDFFDEFDSYYFYTKLLKDIKWETKTLNFSGREVQIPRLTAWYGDVPYTYSGLRLEPNAWTSTLRCLKSAIEERTVHSFNSVLLTTWIYEDGTEELGTGYEFTPSTKIQEIESSDRKGVIGYVEHKAGIVEVIYYDRFVN